MNTMDVFRTSFSSAYVEEQKISRDLQGLINSISRDNPRMPHMTAARILLNHYKSTLRGDFFYVRWAFSRHRTLGVVIEDYRTAIRWLWVVDFETCRPRRLAMVK